MPRKKGVRASVTLHPRLRALRGKETVLGPGRVELLEHIERTGSLTAAAKRMGMSYMRAWSLVKSSNASFRKILVKAARGGKSGGGARLTDAGRQVIALYRRMEQDCQSSVEKTWKELRALFRA
jgi:molybdate transport system regulatory protein